MLQFAYGSYTGREALRDSALTLLERLPAEDNRYMRGWHDAGLTPRSAFESQAVAAGDGILRRQTVRGVPRRAAHPEQSENRKQLTLPPCKNKHH